MIWVIFPALRKHLAAAGICQTESPSVAGIRAEKAPAWSLCGRRDAQSKYVRRWETTSGLDSVERVDSIVKGQEVRSGPSPSVAIGYHLQVVGWWLLPWQQQLLFPSCWRMRCQKRKCEEGAGRGEALFLQGETGEKTVRSGHSVLRGEDGAEVWRKIWKVCALSIRI